MMTLHHHYHNATKSRLHRNGRFFSFHLIKAVCLFKIRRPVAVLGRASRCFGTRDTLKKAICLILSYTLFLLLCHLYESEHTKLMTSLMINLSFAVFYRQSLSCEVIDKSEGDLNSNSKYFPFCPPWSISVALLLFEASTSIFCVLIRQLHSLHCHTICFRFFAVPVV